MSRQQILEMLEKGTITADEAAQLLEALAKGESRANEGSPFGGTTQQGSASVEPDAVTMGPSGPDAERWDRVRQIPFIVAIALLAISGMAMCLVTSRAGGRITFGWVALLLLFMFSVFATAITLWMRSAPWIHVRVEEHDGRRIAISLPLPLTLAQWGLQIARPYVDEHVAGHLDTSAEFLKAMRQNQGAEPLSVDIDEDGQRVQVHIG